MGNNKTKVKEIYIKNSDNDVQIMNLMDNNNEEKMLDSKVEPEDVALYAECKKNGHWMWTKTEWPAVSRLIAIGDIHGDLMYLKRTLIVAKVIDLNDKWIGGSTWVVQLGDQIDRCRPNEEDYKNGMCNKPGTVENDEDDMHVIDYIDKLAFQALINGGRIINLLGNHEINNIKGNMSMVSYESLSRFGYDINNRIAAFARAQELSNHLITSPSSTFVSHSDPRDSYFNNKELKNSINLPSLTHSKMGQYALRFACNRMPFVIIGNWMFGHAGLNANTMIQLGIKDRRTLSELNKKVRAWLQGKETLSKNELFYIFSDRTLGNPLPLNSGDLLRTAIESRVRDQNNNPYTTEEVADNRSEDYGNACERVVIPALLSFNIHGIVVGHTITEKNKITGVCDERVFRVDVGASEAFKRFWKDGPPPPSVLEIINDTKVSILTESINPFKISIPRASSIKLSHFKTQTRRQTQRQQEQNVVTR